jgi:hypothetical protein
MQGAQLNSGNWRTIIGQMTDNTAWPGSQERGVSWCTLRSSKGAKAPPEIKLVRCAKLRFMLDLHA